MIAIIPIAIMIANMIAIAIMIAIMIEEAVGAAAVGVDQRP